MVIGGNVNGYFGSGFGVEDDGIGFVFTPFLQAGAVTGWGNDDAWFWGWENGKCNLFGSCPEISGLVFNGASVDSHLIDARGGG